MSPCSRSSHKFVRPTIESTATLLAIYPAQPGEPQAIESCGISLRLAHCVKRTAGWVTTHLTQLAVTFPLVQLESCPDPTYISRWWLLLPLMNADSSLRNTGSSS